MDHQICGKSSLVEEIFLHLQLKYIKNCILLSFVSRLCCISSYLGLRKSYRNKLLTKPWLFHRIQNYDATCRLAQEIAENIHERSRQQRTGGNPAKVGVSFS